MEFKTCTAIVTPFDENNEVDFDALKNLIEFQIANKIDAILILGTTGEGCTVTSEERLRIIPFCVRCINKRCKLLVGTGSNNTAQAIQLTIQAKALGADGAVLVTPFYNKCTQAGLIEHFKEINKLRFPFIVYNVPSRTGLNLTPDTLSELEKLEFMCGIKEASQDVDHVLEILKRHKKPVYSGNDKLNHLFLSHGGNGCISVLSNCCPNAIVEQWKDEKSSLLSHNKYFNLFKLLFCEVNPIPIKFVLSEMGMIKNRLRMPLSVLTKKNQKKIILEMKRLKI